MCAISLDQYPAIARVINETEAIMNQMNQPHDPEARIVDGNRVTPSKPLDWVFQMPPDSLRHQPLMLLTIMSIGVRAVWQGPLGQHYVGYAPDKTKKLAPNDAPAKGN